jgi:hypothetical protein
MSKLWSSSDAGAWAAALAAYPAVVAAAGVTRLAELDRWYREELPAAIDARTPPSLTLEELTRVTEWKMKRGAWRGRNLALVRRNAPEEVRRRSEEAFALVPDLRRPVAALAALAGVGPATASAALAARHPELYPFFDELVAAQIPELGPIAFTLPFYLRYAARLRERAAQLDAGLTAHALSQALWADAGGKAR